MIRAKPFVLSFSLLAFASAGAFAADTSLEKAQGLPEGRTTLEPTQSTPPGKQDAAGAQGYDKPISFSEVDVDNNGTVSRLEAASLPGVGTNFDKADRNGDMRLSREEFDRFDWKQGAASAGAGAPTDQDAQGEGKAKARQDKSSRAHPDLAERFEQADANGDGQLSKSEFSAYAEPQGGASTGASTGANAPEGRENAMAGASDDVVGKLSESGADSVQQVPISDPRKSFMALERDEDGQLSKTEAASDLRVIEHFAKIDRDGDGSLSRYEFNGWVATARQPAE